MADIELVIKIPEEVYKASQIIDVKYEDVIQIPLEVIKKGIPLPKGHGRLIDSDKLHYIKMLVQNPNNGKHKHIVAVRASEINKALSIIEADKAESEV